MKSLDLSFIILDGIVQRHGTSRHLVFGGGTFNALEDFKVYRSQVRDVYSPAELEQMDAYFDRIYQEKIQHEN